MPDHYRKLGDLPGRLKIFPLRGVILLPRSSFPLNVFEPRYMALVNDALGADRLIGFVQPSASEGDAESPDGKNVALRRIGGAGRLIAWQETDDGRYLITLNGVSRFVLAGEEETAAPYRVFNVDWSQFASDLVHGHGEDAVDRERLLSVLKDYLEVNNLSADWEGISNSSNELLVNTLSMISPYGPEEKQALLEAGDLKTRAEVLVTLAEMDMAGADGSTGSTLQ